MSMRQPSTGSSTARYMSTTSRTVATYDTVDEAVAIHGRLMGPAVAAYLRARNQRTVSWALRIYWMRLS
jgi:hypothetical protein